MGAAYLAVLPAGERDFLLDAIAKSAGTEWPGIKQRLEEAFHAIADRGFCVFEGTYERAMNGVGCALLGPDGAVAAFSCSAPVFQFSHDRLADDIGPRLVAMCAAVKADLARAH
jgi:DNA-binding IclR family transcriptional regulator